MKLMRCAVAYFFAFALGTSLAQTGEAPFEPISGQAGKDVVWVPTPAATVERMLDMARVTPQDFVMDLGSGDGRNIIAAAKRGARGLGVEFNPKMVQLSQVAADKEGVGDKAQFVEGDMFAADISQATVLALFLLPDNLSKLAPRFLNLRPGTRIVVNTFGIEGWTAEQSDTVSGDCSEWCKVMLYVVPARVAGSWRFAQGELTLVQNAQTLSGTFSSGGFSTPIEKGQVSGDRISFTAGGVEFAGRVNGETIAGEMNGSTGGPWAATRVRATG